MGSGIEMPGGGAFRGGSGASRYSSSMPAEAGLKKWTREEHDRCANDLLYFLENWALVKAKRPDEEISRKKKTKTKLVPFKLNEGQRILHEAAEEQLAETGMVRIIVPKGRQLGVSTYISARMMHRCIFSKDSIDAAFMSHDQASLGRLRDQRFMHFMQNLRGGNFPKMGGSAKTKTIRNSTIEMTYASGSEPLRGSSIEFLHLSEVASFDLLVKDGGSMVAAAAMSSVPDTEGTEIWMESTPLGPSGSFYRWCSDASAGENEFKVVFLKTSLDPTYEVHPLPQGWEMSATEKVYAKAHGLDDYHMCWRRRKKRKLGENRFRNEYPETLDECWEMGDTGSYLDPSLVARATRMVKPESALPKSTAPVVLGVDVGLSRDPSVVCVLQGRTVLRFYQLHSRKFVDQTSEINKYAGECNADFVVVDAGGAGEGLHQLLERSSRDWAVVGVVPGGAAVNKGKYSLRKDEIWGRLKEWFEQEDPEPIIYCQTEQIRDKLVEELLAHDNVPDELERVKLTKKDAVRRKIGRSPDFADALTMCFGIEMPKQLDEQGQSPIQMSGSFQAVGSFSYPNGQERPF